MRHGRTYTGRRATLQVGHSPFVSDEEPTAQEAELDMQGFRPGRLPRDLGETIHAAFVEVYGQDAFRPRRKPR